MTKKIKEIYKKYKEWEVESHTFYFGFYTLTVNNITIVIVSLMILATLTFILK